MGQNRLFGAPRVANGDCHDKHHSHRKAEILNAIQKRRSMYVFLPHGYVVVLKA
jgi:hypothetical protein